MKLHELQEARATAVVNMRALADLADTEKRDLTADEETKFSDLKKQIGDLDKKIGRAQTLAEAERTAPAIVHGRLGDGAFEERARDFSITKAIRASRVVAFDDLGMEAIYEFDVRDMPVTVAVDASGASVHETGPREWRARIAGIPVATA